MIFLYFSPLSDLLFNFQSLEAFKCHVQFIKFNGSYFVLVSKKYQFKIKSFSLCSSTYFLDLVFMFRYTACFELIFCRCCKYALNFVYLLILAFKYPIFPASIVEEAIYFFPLNYLQILVDNQLNTYMQVYIWDIYLVPIFFCLYLCSNHTVLIIVAL